MSFSIRKDGIFDPEGKYPNPLTGQAYSQSYKTLALGNKSIGKKGWVELAAWKARVDIIKKIHQNQILLLVLPTGVGKTVIVPLLLLHYFEYKKRVVVTVPRLPLTSEAGEYAARRLDVPLYEVDDYGNNKINPNATGKEDTKYRTQNKIVGYKTSSVGTQFGDKNSVLLFTTDGNIKQSIVSGDKDLSNYGGIIIDEAHERSVNIDILIALVLDITLRRPDFKVIIMSATIKQSTFTNYFKRIGLGDKYGTFKLDKVPTNFEIKFIPSLKNINSNNLTDDIFKKINEIILDPEKGTTGDILAFVTSEYDIIKIKRRIDNNMDTYATNNKPYTICFNAAILPRDKDIAVGKVKLTDLKPTQNAPQGFSRRVMIATNAVESSVTFDGPLKYVIDSGLAFEKKYDAKNYCYETGKILVSQASIIQRCGRTGRNCSGVCIQLYTTNQFDKLTEFTTPKILVEELTNDLLSLSIINGNIPNAMKFMNRMIEEPITYKDSISRAYHNLLNMDLIDAAGNVTNLGYVCNKFNDIKIAKMIIGGYYLGCMNWCLMLGAIITECDSFEQIFVKPLNMDINPKLEQEYRNNIKKFVNENGDHISLLIIFNNFISVPENDRYKYANDNGLSFKTLDNIQKEYDSLVKTVTQQIPYIKNLNLFNVPLEVLIFGGGEKREKLDILSGGNNTDNYAVNNYSDDSSDSDDEIDEGSEYSYQGSDQGSDQGSGQDSDEYDYADEDNDTDEELEDSDIDLEFENEENQLEEYINNKFSNKINNKFSNKLGIVNYSGGGNEDDEDDEDSEDSDDDLNDDFDNETDIFNGGMLDNINIEYNKYKDNKDKENLKNLKNQNSDVSRNNGYEIGDNYQGGFQSTNKNNYSSINSNINSNNRNSKNGRRITNKNNIQNLQYRKHTKKYIIAGGGNSSEDDIKIKKRRKIMDLLDIKNLQPIKITPPSSIIDRILAALFYGYSNNIACYSGNSKKYYVKYSTKQGSIESTSFDFTDKKPDFVIYNEFSINKDMGRSGSKLSMVSEINTHHFGQFIDIQELRKKIKDL